MIAGFFACLFSGHIYTIGIVTVVQIVSFKEVIAIANVQSREEPTIYEKPQLVLLGDNNVLSLWGERHLLL